MCVATTRFESIIMKYIREADKVMSGMLLERYGVKEFVLSFISGVCWNITVA